jgi:hypothetical protein
VLLFAVVAAVDVQLLVPVAVHRYHGRYMTIVVGLAILVDFELHDSVSTVFTLRALFEQRFVLVQSDPKITSLYRAARERDR